MVLRNTRVDLLN